MIVLAHELCHLSIDILSRLKSIEQTMDEIDKNGMELKVA